MLIFVITVAVANVQRTVRSYAPCVLSSVARTLEIVSHLIPTMFPFSQAQTLPISQVGNCDTDQ